jgi:hypothetical protein
MSERIRTYVWIHVDDTKVTNTHEEELDYVKNHLQIKFKITLQDFTKHLEISIEYLETGAIKLRQRKLCIV